MKKIKKYKFSLIITLCVISLLAFSFVTKSVNLNDNIKINKSELKQGDILIVRVPQNQTVQKIIFNQTQYTFKNFNDYQVAFVPVSYWTSAGYYNLTIKTDKNNIKTDIKVISGNFPNSYIEVDTQQEELVRPQDEETVKRKKEDQELIREARRQSIAQKLFTSSFQWPVKGTISTEFGATRYVNDKLQSRHSGIDIACEKGTPIFAANKGVVKLAKNLLVTGNTIIIDHGWEIFSSYSHLEKISVKKGDEVKKGQKIGEVGSTGFSTGPHLHWTITVGSVFVNPHNFLEDNLIDF
jgi:murein DD-endopeptidase MepM/ murein hydrolase activator NlpD